MSKKKICFIAQFPPPMHGLSKAVETLYESELKDQFDFEKVDITNNKKFPRSILAIRKSKADLFYFTISQSAGGNLRDLMILKLLHMQKKKCIIHLHGGYYRTLVDRDMAPWQKKANYKAIGRLDGAIVLGPSLKYIFEGMLPEEKIYTVANCVDDQYLMDSNAFQKKVDDLDANRVREVLYLSNFIREKGYRHVLEMARLEKVHRASGNTPRFHFHFAGKFFDPEEEQFFFDFVRTHQLDECITYHGVVGGEQKQDLLNRCHLFVLLTRYPKEGQPISILEAMGNGMMIVTTNHAGIPDIVTDGVNGIVCTETEPDLNAVMERMSSMELARIMRENRRSVEEDYQQAAYIRHMQQIFIR